MNEWNGTIYVSADDGEPRDASSGEREMSYLCQYISVETFGSRNPAWTVREKFGDVPSYWNNLSLRPFSKIGIRNAPICLGRLNKSQRVWHKTKAQDTTCLDKTRTTVNYGLSLVVPPVTGSGLLLSQIVTLYCADKRKVASLLNAILTVKISSVVKFETTSQKNVQQISLSQSVTCRNHWFS